MSNGPFLLASEDHHSIRKNRSSITPDRPSRLGRSFHELAKLSSAASSTQIERAWPPGRQRPALHGLTHMQALKSVVANPLCCDAFFALQSQGEQEVLVLPCESTVELSGYLGMLFGGGSASAFLIACRSLSGLNGLLTIGIFCK